MSYKENNRNWRVISLDEASATPMKARRYVEASLRTRSISLQGKKLKLPQNKSNLLARHFTV